jgi:uncharacterized protein DUF6186/uncharacterized protein DUF6256
VICLDARGRSDVTDLSGLPADSRGSSASRGVDTDRRISMIGIIGWAVIFGAFLVWEGLGLAIGQQWPTMSHMLRMLSRPVPGRLVLFGIWLWLGWHLLIQGWHFFLRGPLPEPHPQNRLGHASLRLLWSRVVLPLIGFFALSLTMLTYTSRRLDHRGKRDVSAYRAAPLGRPLFVIVAITVAAGYLAFVAMVGLYVLFSAQDSELLHQALTGGALLAFGVATPAFMLLSWAQRRTHESPPKPTLRLDEH